jgi:hypothetical protein
VLLARATAQATELVRLTVDGLEVLAQLPPGKYGWIVGTACPDGASFTFGSDNLLALGAITSDGQLSMRAPLPLALDQVVHDSDPAHDRVHNLCAAQGHLFALARDPRDNLLAIGCQADVACESRAVASGVRTFAALSLDEQATLVAYAGSKNLAQLRLQTLGPNGERRAAERVPSACWAPSGGMCGTPVLGRVGSRILLGAREGTDLMVLESADRGVSWEPLRGLKQNESAPL